MCKYEEINEPLLSFSALKLHLLVRITNKNIEGF